ncbi:hypothetical protein GQX74_014136 [Glossina fuscipes]|nr:hypothetical protein GQX74_014136 [Glossina fuscipes]
MLNVTNKSYARKIIDRLVHQTANKNPVLLHRLGSETVAGKARCLKQAKEEPIKEIEKYWQERERQFKEIKHMGSREDVAAKIRADTQVKL